MGRLKPAYICKTGRAAATRPVSFSDLRGDHRLRAPHLISVASQRNRGQHDVFL